MGNNRTMVCSILMTSLESYKLQGNCTTHLPSSYTLYDHPSTWTKTHWPSNPITSACDSSDIEAASCQRPDLPQWFSRKTISMSKRRDIIFTFAHFLCLFF